MLSTRLTIIAFLAVAWCWTSHGLSDLACPGVNSELKCPEGQVIHVQSIGYGIEDPAVCKARDRSEEVPTSAKDSMCDHMLPWTKRICDETNRCRLPKPCPYMFESDYSEDNYIVIEFTCKDQRPGLLNVVACEGHVADIKCASGKIKIVTANFGRLDETTCIEDGGRSLMTFCSSNTSEDTVKKMCENHSECSVKADSDTLGKCDDCDSHPKYLTVDYVCE